MLLGMVGIIIIVILDHAYCAFICDSFTICIFMYIVYILLMFCSCGRMIVVLLNLRNALELHIA
ncbi:hypothetical protein V1505DRAFT_368393 [Lipomyces doorenjongii]